MSGEKLHILLVDNLLSHTSGGIPTVASALVNGMAERGHKVSLYTEKNWRRRSQYPLHTNVALHFYRFTDNNLKIQQLRKELRVLNPDVCCPLFHDNRHLVWAVTLLGSGIPLLYSEYLSPERIENKYWSRKGRLAAMSGADRIHLPLPSFVESVPDFLRPIVRVIPKLEPHTLEIFLDAWEALFLETAACKGNTVMDSFKEEPFASMARLSSAARREWLFRDFGKPMPGSFEHWLVKYQERVCKFGARLLRTFR